MTFVDDTTGTLGTDAIGRINAATSSLDVKVVVASTGSRGDLDAMVGRLVNSANTVAIGVDPIHRYTFTHFGTGTGISSGDYQTIARAGNGEFKAGHWEQGIEAIVASANAASVRTQARSSVIVQQPVTVVEKPVSAWPFILGFAALALGVLLVMRWMKKRSAEQARVLDGFREEASQMRSRNVEEQGWHDKMAAKVNNPARPPGTENNQPTPEQKDREAYERTIHRPPTRSGPTYPAPARAPAAPAPTVHHHHHDSGGGGNDLLTGVLIGNAISAPREVVRERHRTPTPAPSSSSSSDWGSSSSSDSGSGGGGGFDSGGGGGFDGGSGGGDF